MEPDDARQGQSPDEQPANPAYEGAAWQPPNPPGDPAYGHEMWQPSQPAGDNLADSGWQAPEDYPTDAAWRAPEAGGDNAGNTPWGAPGWPGAEGYPPGSSWPPPPYPPQGHQGWGYGGWQQPPPPSGPGGWQNHPGWGGPYGPPPRRGARTALVTALLVVLAAVLGTSIGHLAWRAGTSANAGANNGFQNPITGPGSNGDPFGGGGGFNGGSSNNTGPSNSSGGPANVGSIAAKVQSDLVDINTTLQYQQALAAGTGVVLTSNGEVLTNNHVIAGATKISATDIGNGKTYSATVVGYDESHDIAVLQLQHASGLATAKIGDSSKLSVGESVVGIGNAGGAGGAPSSAGGSITALNQSITASDELDGSSEQLSGLIATNANIQSGDSGGPLVNKDGTVIGLDTAASSGFSFSSQNGQGFAIPINQAMSIHRQIKAGDASASVHIGPTAFIGVLIDSQASGQSNGAVISQAVAGGAAAQAGLQQGDTITSINGQAVSTPAEITKLLIPLHPGDHMRLGWLDTSGQSHTSTVTLTKGPPA